MAATKKPAKKTGVKKTVGKTAAVKKNPWNNVAPKKAKHKKLTPKQKQSARSAATKAGRPYPNLIDNMRVAKAKKVK